MVLSEIRQEARGKMQGLWGTCVPIWLIYILIMMVPGIIFSKIPVVQFVISLVLGGPFIYALSKIFLRICNDEVIEIGQLFEGFSEFTRAFTAYALMMLYVLLWTLLLIIPGIIAGLGYGMTFFIMADNPNIAAGDALRQSKEMMNGHKWELFWLGLSFIGWMLLCIVTFGIGLLWLESYIMASYVVFYQKISGKKGKVELTPDEKFFKETASIL